MHGQHIAVGAVRSYINAHMLDNDPKKALSLAFHGGPGTGKTYISRSIIAESLYDKGMKSNYVHFISATHHFPEEANIKQYKVNVKHFILYVLNCNEFNDTNGLCFSVKIYYF